MASKTQVTILYLCTDILLYISFIFAATIFKDNLELTVPHTAKVGHIITKLGCSDKGLSLQIDGNPLEDKLFSKLFSIDKSGNLVVKDDISSYEGKYFVVSTFSDQNCFDNVAFKRSFGIFIQNSQEYLDLKNRIYRGFVYSDSKPGYLIHGLESVLSNPSVSCSLQGESSKFFELLSYGVHLHSKPPLNSRVFYLSLLCSDGNKHGHAGLLISFLQKEDKSKSKEDPYHISSNSDVAIRQVNLVKSFDQGFISLKQEPHLRFRRDTVPTTLSVIEGTTSIITLDNPQTGVTTLQWAIEGDAVDTDTFTIVKLSDGKGNVNVKQGKQLDYDYAPQRSYRFDVVVRTADGQTVLRIYQVDITVTDRNDEKPVITNHPTPYQTTVDRTSSAGTLVYQLKAYDPDTTAVIRFYLEGTNSEFDVEPNTGWIKTKRTLPNAVDSYIVRVFAQDTAATDQKSETKTVTVYTGNLKPQFNETSYTARVLETNQPDQTFDTLSPKGDFSLVHAINFQRKLGGNTAYSVLDGTSISDKFKIDDSGHLVTLTSLDYEKDPKTFALTVQAEDTYSQLKSSVDLTVYLEDRNEFDPTFSLSTYTAKIPEDLPIGSPVLTVTANDKDLNSVLTFWVSEPLFRVQSLTNTTGQLQVNSSLDYDRQISRRYEFDIYVKDSGVPSRTSQAKILIDLRNVNDEYPQFQEKNMVTTIKDNISPGTTVYIVQAVDLDGDKVSYALNNNQQTQEIFEIESTTGRIKLRSSSSIPSDRDQYVLTVLAKDDSSCCTPLTTSLTSTSSVTINIVDAVNTKPSFRDCNTYTPTVQENKPVGTSVITVSATDNNRGDNGAVEYFAVTPGGNQPVYFEINQTSGELTTKEILDRESFGSRYLFFTVRAVDKGQPPGDDYCTFSVTIGDDNDNSPEFGSNNFEGSVLRTAANNVVVMTVKATDKDIGDNAEVVYSEVENTTYFDINSASGVITVASNLNSAPNSVTFSIKATDKGTPPRSSPNVTITIIITNDDGGKPPIWNINTPAFSVNETSPIDTLVGSLTATSQIQGSTGVTFTVISDGQAGSQVSPFRIMQDSTNTNQVNIYLLDPLDYEKATTYTFQLRAKDTSKEVYTDVFPVITVLDQNDEIPKFRGADTLTTYIEASVLENQAAGAAVTTIAATDDDVNSQFKQLRYSLFGAYAQNFTINPTTGAISTRSTFDREATDSHYYLLQVKVEDGFPSARPGANGQPNSDQATVRVTIADENDNAPVFPQAIYYAQVKEDAFISSVVTTVEANDKDEAVFTYDISPGSGSSLFSIKTIQLKGEILVAGTLDYETGAHAYNLTVVVNDGLFSDSTLVEVSIVDVNDNPPVFEPQSYEITNITEEVQYSPSVPLKVTTVKATDPDTFRDKGIEYRLSDDDPVITQLFTIDSTTGELNLIGKLDRDRPNGREVYQFNVLAIDEPGETTRLTGYATVQIKPLDINDNAPVFIPSSPTGSVEENSPIGAPVMTIVADDYDAGLNGSFTFSLIGPETPSSAFRINTDSGEVFTTVNNLDREKDSTYTFVVLATDKGTPSAQTGTATVTINIKDVNDNAPVFEKDVYKVTIPETHSGVVITIVANDPDIDDTLRYSLNSEAYKHFTMTTQGRQGILGVYNGSNPDYEAGETFFNLTAFVFDGDDTHTRQTNIQITIEDVNDEIPIFENQNVEKNIVEGPSNPSGTLVTTFKATDRDNGDNGKISYFISKNPIDQEPRKYFELENFNDAQGQLATRVKLLKELDRETIKKHTVYVLAIDGGTPQLTGTATLTVNVGDINDEYPRIDPTYATIMEGKAVNTLFVTVKGVDPDLPENGPPFGFEGIPCPGQSSNGPQCKFDVAFDSSYDGGNGGANIRNKVVFDREQQKFYYLPIKAWDRRGVSGALSMTGTNTLTVEIGDINDNIHGPGTQEIHVYNYKGMFKNIPIGAVNYADLDDHDIGDKTFTYKSPDDHRKLFSVNSDDGVITMLTSLPSGTWTFQVDVYDRVDGLTTTSTVNVKVEEMPEEAPYRSGSVRLSGTTPKDFITPDSNGKSPYDKFRERLASKLGTDVNNVEMISVLQKDEFTDVRFSAHGSPYYSPTKMNGAVLRDMTGFESASGGKIEVVNIDECLKESCESGCYNYLNVTGNPNLVSIRGNSIVGVETFVMGKCGCHEPVSQTECDPTYCYNGGKCQKDYWNVLSCDCPAGFDGPRCQSTRHGFDGKGYALYKPLEQCENSETSIEFITSNDNGLIMYNGPVSDNFEPVDYMSLELSNGYPVLKIDHGSGARTMSISSPSLNGGAKLSDGKWHHINIMRRGKEVTMTVDYCRDIAPSSDGIVDDRSICEVTMSTPGENMFLNVNAPLQLGGRYTQPNLPSGITTNKFNGCVRNLRHNAELYDLYTGSGTYPGSFDGCPKEDESCNKNSVNLPKKCGDNGDCQITNIVTGETICICHSGWRGDNCETKTTVKDLYSTGSYMDWLLEAAFKSALSQWETDIHVMYRTRDNDGVIFHVSSTADSEFIKLEIVSNRVQVLYNLGDGNHVVSLDRVVASDGQWHEIILKRRGKFFSLAMDNGEGPRYAETQGPDYGHHLLEVRASQIYAGADLNYEHSTIEISKDLNSTCLNDIRLATAWFPMTTTENSQNVNVKLNRQINTRDNCVRDDCANVVCPPTFVCRPLWEAYECVCPVHHVKVGSVCEPIDYCSTLSPCHPDATCVNDVNNEHGYRCICHPGWEGRTCYQQLIVADDTSSAYVEIWLPIVLIILIVVILALIWWKCRRTDEGLIEEDEKEDYEVRENVMDYDEEGAGEDDYEGHITGIGRLPDPSHFDKPVRVDPLNRGAPPGGPGIGDFIGERLEDADDDGGPPYDTTKTFDYEGGGSDAGSLSSLNTSTSGGDQDYDYLNEWGPKFAKLADMYNKYEDSE